MSDRRYCFLWPNRSDAVCTPSCVAYHNFASANLPPRENCAFVRLALEALEALVALHGPSATFPKSALPPEVKK